MRWLVLALLVVPGAALGADEGVPDDPVPVSHGASGYMPATAEYAADAKVEFDKGLAAAAAEDFSAAIKHFHFAQEIESSPAGLFNLARAYQDISDYEAAIRYYRLFISARPDHVGDVRAIIAVLQARLDLKNSRPGGGTVQDPASPAPLAVPGPPGPEASQERLAAIRAFRNRRLSVRNVTEFRGGGTSYQPGLGGIYVATDPIYTVQKWGLFQGNHQLNNLRYYEVLGATAKFDDLKQRVRTNKQLGFGLYAVGVGGVFASLVGVLGRQQAQSTSEYTTYTGMMFGGTDALKLELDTK
jgi:tetratricopeptide (TPR) repeat protein